MFPSKYFLFKSKGDRLPSEGDGSKNTNVKSEPKWRIFRGFKTVHSRTSPKEWKSWKLQNPTLISLLGVTIGLIVAIAVLDCLSRAHSGFVPVTTQSSTLTRYIWHKGLLWTALPTFILSLYRLAVDAVISANSDRQPYIELRRQEGSSPEKSILLDYRSYAPAEREYRALRNGHLLILASFLLSTALNLGVGPLSARLFLESTIAVNSSVFIQQNTFFDEVNGFDTAPPFVPIFDTVAATLIYGGAWPTWSDGQYSYRPFSIPSIPTNTVEPANLTVITSAYSAGLNCVDLKGPEFNLNVSYTGTSTQGQMSILALDRGCPLSVNFLTQTNTIHYLETFADIDCPFNKELSRLVVIGATFPASSPSQPTSLTALSCVPWYSSTDGQLEVGIGLDGVPQVRRFVPSANGIEIRRPEWWRTFEWNLHAPYTFDNNDDSSTTVLGSLILDLAKRDHPRAFLDSENLINATNLVFTSTYATLATADLYRLVATMSSIKGMLQTSETRLLVYSPVAYTIIGVLAALAVVLVCTLIYVGKHDSILYEEPIGIFGQAAVVADSDLIEMVQETRKSRTFDGTILKTIKGDRLLRGGQCHFDKWQEPNKSRIVLSYREHFFKSFGPGKESTWRKLISYVKRPK